MTAAFFLGAAMTGQFFSLMPDGTPSGQASFVQNLAINVPAVGLSDITITPDGRIFVITDAKKLLEVSDHGLLLRTITLGLSDLEALAWTGENLAAGTDRFALLHEGTRVVRWVDIPKIGNHTIQVGATTQLELPGTGAIFESMRRDPFGGHLVVSRTSVNSDTVPPYEVIVFNPDGGNPPSWILSGFVLSPASEYFQKRSTFQPDTLLLPLSVERTGSGLIRIVERESDGSMVSYQQIETLGTYVEGIAAKRNSANNGWWIYICRDVNSSSAVNFYRYERLE